MVGAGGAGGLGAARKAVVLDEIARSGARLAEGFGDAPDGVLGDVLVKRVVDHCGTPRNDEL
ncbi:hypothetical protein WME91_46685 [Sorangium sp. So ce269]